MLKQLQEDISKIGQKVGKENLFELAPLYLITQQSYDSRYLQHILNNLQCHLELESLMPNKSDAVLELSLEYNPKELQTGISDETGTFKETLERWISYIKTKYHIGCGIVLINVRDFKGVSRDCLFWKRLFLDIQKHKENFLFFVSCNSMDTQHLQTLLEKEIFIKQYDLTSFNLDDYLKWVTLQFKKYRIPLDEKSITKLKRLFKKHENQIDYHVMELWLQGFIWEYFSNEDASIFPLAESSLRSTISKCKTSPDGLTIGFVNS